MQRHLLTDGKREIWMEYANEWDEMTPKQAVYAGKLLYWLTKEQITVDQFRSLMVAELINHVPDGGKKVTEIDKKIDYWSNTGQLMDTVNWFFSITKDKEGRERYEIVPRLTRNLVPELKTGKFRILRKRLKLYGPGDFMGGMTFAQFKDSLTACHKYMETRDDEWLVRLAAILYVPKGEKYSADNLAGRMKQLRKADRGTMQLVFCYIMGCMQVIRTDNNGNGIEIDGTECRFSKLFSKGEGGSGGGEGIGLTGVLMTLAESGVFGNIKETANADVWDVLVRLYQLELQREEMEKAYSSKP